MILEPALCLLTVAKLILTGAPAFTFSLPVLPVSPLSQADMLSFPKGGCSGRNDPVFSLSLLLMRSIRTRTWGEKLTAEILKEV